MSAPPFHKWLIPEAVSAQNDRIEILLPFRPEFAHSTEPGFIHGGIIATLIDIAGHGMVAVAQRCKAPTVSLQIDYLCPAPAGDLHATAYLRKLGQTLSRADVEVMASGKLVAIGRGTFTK